MGMQKVVLVGGMESMSNVPHYLPQVRSGQKMGHIECQDGMILDGLWDPYEQRHMGNFAEKCAEHHGLTREDQDGYAIRSFERALAATEEVTSEITQVIVRDKKGKETTVSKDEGIKRFNREKLTQLNPSFQTPGTVTAGNASQVKSRSCREAKGTTMRL